MPAKSRTNVSLDSALLSAAHSHGLNVSAIAEAEGWARDNAEAIARRRACIDREGPPLAGWQAWRPDRAPGR